MKRIKRDDPEYQSYLDAWQQNERAKRFNKDMEVVRVVKKQDSIEFLVQGSGLGDIYGKSTRTF